MKNVFAERACCQVDRTKTEATLLQIDGDLGQLSDRFASLESLNNHRAPCDFIAKGMIATVDRTGSNEKHDLFKKYIRQKHDEYTALFNEQFD